MIFKIDNWNDILEIAAEIAAIVTVLFPLFKYVINKVKDKTIEQRQIIVKMDPRHKLTVAPEIIEIPKNGGFFNIIIDSDTKWNIYVNQNKKKPLISKIDPLNGNGQMTVTIYCEALNQQNYEQSAILVVKYKSWGLSQEKSICVWRKHLPHQI